MNIKIMIIVLILILNVVMGKHVRLKVRYYKVLCIDGV